MRIFMAVTAGARSVLAWVALPLVLSAQAGDEIERLAQREPVELAVDVRVQAAETLRSVDPARANRLVAASRKAADGVTDPQARSRCLAEIASVDPSEAALSTPAPPRAAATPDAAALKIGSRLKELRGDLSQSERAKLAESFAADIGALRDRRTKLALAEALANYATEGDLGREALQAVTDTLGRAIREAEPDVAGRPFLELARLVRYEHMQPPISDPSLDSRLALLALRDQTIEKTRFTLTGIDGKTYALGEMKGKVVVVNFWATWCPPCRKEMPDLEQLSRRFRDRGLVVLAISDEAADTVKPFIAKQGYTFPVLLDPERKVNTAFHVEGIPKTFIFGRDGKLAAQSIDMRTKEQFLALLKQAGME